MSKFENKKILFIVTGSIASYKIAAVLSQLKKNNCAIKVVATQSALKFIGISTLEGLTSEKVHTELFDNGSNMDHIHLIRWADIVVVAPATANFINKIAHGFADDLASTLFLAHDFKKPFLIFPAMNTKMYQHPATTRSLEILTKWNIRILDSASGSLACGETGVGRLLEPEQIIAEIDKAFESIHLYQPSAQIKPDLSKSKASSLKVLITSGGTQEPLDDVRVITNSSTGKTAAYLADEFIEHGFDVTYLMAENAKMPLLNCNIVKFKTFKDLQTALEEHSKIHHFIIHAAAVSDYSVLPTEGKINSDQEILQINLKKNPKLIDQIKKNNPNAILIGFKLTSTQDPQLIKSKIDSLFKNSKCDLIVHNDWSTIKSDQHLFNLVNNKQNTLSNLTLSDLACELVSYALKETL
ncbi:MAG: bifunctional phosphopantothenoylcysteine decarboxylase/phosphopantothenate--cysteine ligase CoaBC [Pseudobdellovibrio sp.]